MNNLELNSLLYEVPEYIDYTDLPEDLDAADIPENSVTALRMLLKESADISIQYRTAFLLTNWGYEDGLAFLMKLFDANHLVGLIAHSLHAYDDTYKHVLDALVGYWAKQADSGAGDIARKKIYHPVEKIINASNKSPFEISGMFWLIQDEGFTEYLPLIKHHLSIIINKPEVHGWKIHDAIELLLNFDAGFVINLLSEKGKTLKDFNF